MRQAPQSSTSLIEASLNSVERGKSIVADTAEVLDTSVDKVKALVTNMEKISDASQRQAQQLDEITRAVEQIASVVEENTAMAEESSASSQELASQSQVMKQLIDQFKLME